MFLRKAGSLCFSRQLTRELLLSTNKVRANLFGGTPDSFQTDKSYIVRIEHGNIAFKFESETIELRRPLKDKAIL